MIVALLALLACVPLSDSADAAPAADMGGLTWTRTAATAAPMALTASDGTGLTLASMKVRAVVEDPLAFTEVHLVFENPEDRVLEGRFEITLPPGAAVSRFAMKLGDQWQEGEVVELQAARRAYEDFLHRRTDPALLEFDAGNEFTARVFPIPAKGKKELILSWSHDLDATEPWTLPTGGLPELGLLSAEVSVGGRTLTMTREYAVPEGDLTVAVPRPSSTVSARGEGVAVVRVQPELSVDRDPVRSATLLVDTSASRALSLDEVLVSVQTVVGSFAKNTPVKIVAWDQTRQTVYEGPAGGLTAADLQEIADRQALGASDLAAALREVEGSRVILFTDGVATAGEQDLADLRAAIVALKGVERMDAVVSGGVRDEASLAELVTAGLPRHGVVLDADRTAPAEIARRLGLGASGDLEVEVAGASWVWPETVSGIQPGDSVTVYAGLPEGRPLGLTLDGRAVPVGTPRALPGPLLTRSAAQAEIGRLHHLEARATDRTERERIAARMIEVSTSQRVLSPHTALLVLETEQDYERFGIPRNALADILTVEKGRLTWIERGTPVFGQSDAVEPPIDASRVREDDGELDDGMEKKKSEEREEAPAAEAPAAPQASRARRSDAAAPPRELAMDEEARVASPEKSAATDPLSAWEGQFREVMSLILANRLPDAERLARAWRAESPGDPLALLALGEVLERSGRKEEAARVYGSLIDLFPSRADLRRLAGERLETLGEAGLPLAIDTYRVAVSQRADHPSGHRNLAWALARHGEHRAAVEVLVAAKSQEFSRFEAAHQILAEDAAIIAAAWRAKDGTAPVAAVLAPLEVSPATGHALRFVLNWETDANDVDFHIYDSRGGHAFYSDRELPSGGTLYADITSGYGPECFAISKPSAFPYRLQAHYYSRGPMGFGMGKLQIVEHDGRGGLFIEDRPFIVMTDGAFVELGEVSRSGLR